MRLRTKLSMSFLSVALVIAVLAVPAILNTRTIGESFTQLNEESIPQTVALEKMQTDSVSIYSRALEYTVEDDEEELNDYKEEIAAADNDFNVQYNKLTTTALSYDENDLPFFDSIHTDWLDFRMKTYDLIALVDQEKDEENISEARETLESSQEKFTAAIDSALAREQEENNILQTKVQSALESSLILLLVGFSAAAAISLVMGNIIAANIAKFIIHLRNAFDGLLSGKSDVLVEQEKAPAKELSDLATHFNAVRTEMAEKERMQQEFLMLASHELRTPIQPILAYSDLAQRKAIPPEKAFEVIRREAQRLKRLTEDILDATKIDAGHMRYVMEEIPFASFIEEMAETAANSNKDRQNLTITSEIEIDNKYAVTGDRQRLSQAIWNIVNNAIRFTPEGSVRLVCRLDRNHHSGQFFAHLMIIDTGSGIPADVLPNLFKKFASKDPEGKAREGTGLGLFISKAIIEAHRGEITVAPNTEGRGTTFTIMLPLNQYTGIIESSTEMAASPSAA